MKAIVSLVDFCRRFALPVVVLALAATVALSLFAARNLGIDTDTNHLISSNLPWRKNEAEKDRLFPQNTNLIAVVVDGVTADRADTAAAALAKRLEQRPELFDAVRRPDGGEFFARNGLLFLSAKELQSVSDQLIAAQPLIGTLAADPSLRGVFDALTLALQGVERGEIELSSLDEPFGAIAQSIDGAIAGAPHPIAWQSLLTGRAPTKQELRRFILVHPVLDYSSLEPGARATAAIRKAARELGLTPEHGVRVRLTGSVPLADEEFATVAEGTGLAMIVSVVLVCIILFLALNSLRIIIAILLTLMAGLAATAAFAVVAVGSLNLISVAFAVLFVGIAVDFGIQFSTRYREERHRTGKLDEALRRAASGIGGSLILAAITTSVGFFSFVPNAYSGVSELGIIAGTSMVIAFLLNLTLLPALLTLMRPAGEREQIGFAAAAPVDRFLVRHRRPVIIGALATAGLCLALAPQLRFDFNPLDLKDPHTESVSTLFDLMSDPSTTPYTVDVLAPSPQAAVAVAERFDKLPQVAQTVSINSFVPEDQDKKLAIISDLALLLGPTLNPPTTKPAPTAQEALQAMARTRDALAKLHPTGPAAHLLSALDHALARGAAIIPALKESIVEGLEHRLESLREALKAQPVSLKTLPSGLKRAWVAPNGLSRVEVFPVGDTSNNQVLRKFVAAIRAVAPNATGTPISIVESGNTVVNAFVRAGWIALLAIVAVLAMVLRRVRDVGLVLAPLALAALLTVGTMVAIGMPLNYANIIALPLLLGIGVSFDIYFVMNWRAGRGSPLQSSIARAVLFSALTTTTAFGSLALSSHPGTAEMGKLLTIMLGWTLFCTLFLLPALLGPVNHD